MHKFLFGRQLTKICYKYLMNESYDINAYNTIQQDNSIYIVYIKIKQIISINYTKYHNNT